MIENEFDATPPAPLEEESQPFEAAPQTEGEAPKREKRRRRGGRAFTLFLASVGLLATALGAIAVAFKNQDPRLGAIADAIEQAAQNPKDFILKEKEELGAWVAQKLPHGEEEPKAASAPSAGDEVPKPTELAPVAVESAPSAPSPAAPKWDAPHEVQEKPPAQKAEAEPKPSATPQSPAPSSPVASAEIAPLLRRLEALEADIRAANDAAAEARRAAEAKPPSERTEVPAATPETKNAIAALEARLDELTQSMGKLQQQLDQPKVGTRATPDIEPAAHAAPAGKALTALESLALAQAVQGAVERAKPFTAELAALRRLGADPKALAALAPFAEKGAPTPRDLLSAFEPLAKKLRAFENKPPEGTPLSEKLVHEATKLVHLRPKGEAAKPTADDLTPKIEKALAHDDLAEAQQTFAALPEATRAQAKEFGETLAARVRAEDAAAALVANAIGDLDSGKN